MPACHTDVTTDSKGSDCESERRVRVTPLTRPCRARAGSPNGPADEEYWKDTRMPMRYGEKVLASRGAMARAAKSQGRC
jgi:hypothetical protein